MSDSVGQYLNEIGMVPLLNAQEERQLSQTIEAGTDARTRKEAENDNWLFSKRTLNRIYMGKPDFSS